MANIHEGLKICEGLESILRDTFGPCGLDVMLSSSSGSILITNSGAVILSSLSIGHPMGRMVVDKVMSHNDICGDGVTAFIIVLTQALREITKRIKIKDGAGQMELKPQSWQSLISLSNAFSRIDSNVLPNTIIPALKAVALETEINQENITEVKKNLMHVINTALSGKFVLHCQKLFASLLTNLIDKTCSFETNFYQCILDMVDNFSQFCVEYHGVPVKSSQAIEGIVIQRQFATEDEEVLPSPGLGYFSFVVLQCSLDDNRTEARVVMEVKSAEMFTKALSYKRNNTFAIVKLLKKQGIQLLISTEGVSDMALHLCQHHDISVIQMVPLETANHICKYAMVQPLCDLDHHNISNMFMGKGLFCKTKTLGSQKFIHLGIKHDTTSCGIHTILLCAPTRGICQQYFIALHNSLRNVKMAFVENKQIRLLPGCGSTELILSMEFEKLAKSSQDVNISSACTILSKSLLQVPKTLHSNSHSCSSRNKNFITVLQKMESSWKRGVLVGVNGKLGNVIDPVSQTIYEPYLSKLYWINHLLQCLSMIIRVEKVIGVKCIKVNYKKGEFSDSDSEDDD